MGRFVSVASGDFKWEWKFWFARQCSNFGEVLAMVEGDDVGVTRYVSDSGEYVDVVADKETLIKRLKKLKLDACPVCGNGECLEATKEMIKNFTEALKKYDGKELCAIFFVEYT